MDGRQRTTTDDGAFGSGELIISRGPNDFREEDLFKFSHYKSMGANDHRSMANVDHRGMVGMVGRIYVGNHLTLLHTVSLGLMVSVK